MNFRVVSRDIKVKPTLTDKLVSWLNPVAGLQRLRNRAAITALSGGYEGGRRRNRGTLTWRPKEASADADIMPDLPDLRARSRDLARNMPIATGAIATTVTNVIGDGLALQSTVDRDALKMSDEEADEWQRAAEREWALFCATADFSKIQSLQEMQALLFRAVQESGDALVVRRYRKDPGDTYGTKLQVIEADRLSNPNFGPDTETMVGGIEFDSDGAPIRYHFAKRHPGNVRNVTMEWQSVPARSQKGLQLVIHLYDRLRPEQSRGVPYLAPVVESLRQLGDYSDAELKAAVVSSLYTTFITTDAPEDSSPLEGEEARPDLAQDEIALGSGAVVTLAPGEKIETANPARPNERFDPFMMAMLRQIGVALELPFELLVKHFTASYSASRAALEMAWQFFRRRRTWMARRFCQVAYEWCIEEAISEGRLLAPGFFSDEVRRRAYLQAEWIGPARMSIDPYKEAQADQLDVQMGTKTLSQVITERTGGDFERKTDQRSKEVRMRKAAGLEETPKPEPSADALQDPNEGDRKDQVA